MIRAVLFDFDGIIADTEELHYQSYQVVLKEKGAEFSYDDYAARYMAFDSIGCFRQRAADLGMEVSDEDIRIWAEEKNSAYEKIIASQDVPPLPGAVEAVKLAASKGPVAVCTGAVLQDVEALLEKYGLTPLLSAIVTADDVTISKPDPESYALACKRVDQSPENCLAIEDTPGGLQSAKNAGCQTLGITTTHTQDQLRPFADRISASLVDWVYPS